MMLLAQQSHAMISLLFFLGAHFSSDNLILVKDKAKRPSNPLSVFGNGRTHTGEVDGSGGSRLANYCLRVPTSGVESTSPSGRKNNITRTSKLERVSG